MNPQQKEAILTLLEIDKNNGDYQNKYGSHIRISLIRQIILRIFHVRTLVENKDIFLSLTICLPKMKLQKFM